jgi:hypothetical protein
LSSKIVSFRVALGADTEDVTTLTGRGTVVGKMAPLTSWYQNNQTFRDAMDDFIKSAAAYGQANPTVTQLEQALEQARNDRNSSRKVCLDCHGVAAKQVEKTAKAAGDITLTGFTVLDIAKLGLVVPSDVSSRYDAAQELIRLHAKYSTPGTRFCAWEYSADMNGPFTRLEGTGVKRAFPGFAKGTWWFRVATLVKDARSGWYGPFSVTVK